MKTKQTFLIVIILLCCNCVKGALPPLGVQVEALSDDWCNSWSGSMIANVSGGTPPYTYLWNIGVTTQSISSLPTGYYTVTVIDSAGTTVSGGNYISPVSQPDFYLLALRMPDHGASNGLLEWGVYAYPASHLAPGNYTILLYDSSNLGFPLRTDTMSCPFCSTGNAAWGIFDSLPAGHYSLVMTYLGFGCATEWGFILNELPAITPSTTSLPACNGSPTGKLIINIHPSPAIDTTTYQANLTTTLPGWSPSPWSPQGTASFFYARIKTLAGVEIKQTHSRDSVFSIDSLSPGTFRLEIMTGDSNYYGFPMTQPILRSVIYTDTIVIVNDTTCSLVQGRLFADYNNDCIYNGTDISLKGTLIELSPGGYSAITNGAGQFYIPVPTGVYTLKQYPPYQYVQQCPDTSTFIINNNTPGQIFDVQIADSINTAPDAQVGLWPTNQPRPGFNYGYHITYRNLTANLIPAQTITLNYDTTLNFINAIPIPSSSTQGQLTWNVASLINFGVIGITANFNIPASVPIGTILSANAFVNAIAGEIFTGNNNDCVSQTVTGSYDPNDKSVSVGYGSQGYITDSEVFKYTVRFQNTGNDTAFNVIVADTLASTLNKYSLQVLDASHHYWYEFKNPNVVLFHFDNILLADSNVNEEASHGYIKFSIAQIPGNTTGTQIKNTAAIYFDFNAPVITNEVSNTIFDCNAMAGSALSSQTICEGDSIWATSNLLFDMNTDWYVDAVLYSSDSIATLTNILPGTHQIELIASNNSCSQSVISNITVNALPLPVITQNGFTLTSSVLSGNQWLFNGGVIVGATNNLYNVTESGYFSVLVTDSNGCSAMSDSIYMLVTNVSQNQISHNVTVVPNPVSNEFTVYGLQFSVGDVITIMDAMEKIVYQKKVEESSSGYKCTGLNFTSGIYFVAVKTYYSNVVLKIEKQ